MSPALVQAPFALDFDFIVQPTLLTATAASIKLFVYFTAGDLKYFRSGPFR